MSLMKVWGGWFITKHVNGPGKRCRHRSEGFSGCHVITRSRVVCYAYWKRQISISVEDPKVSQLYVYVPEEQRLSVSFESSAFRDGWRGVMEFRFNTKKDSSFRDALISIGAQHGVAADTDKPHRSSEH